MINPEMIIAGALVDGGTSREGWIELEGPLLTRVGGGDPPRPADLVHGGLIAPGLVDLQVNGGHGVEVVDGLDALATVDALQLRSGVTSYLPTIITTDDATALRAAEQIGELVDDKDSPVAGVHLEGPFLNPMHRGVHRAELLRLPVDGIPPYCDHPAVRLVTLAPELPGALELIERLTDRGVAVSLGHTGADSATAEAAAARGARLVTHLFNGMGALHHRSVGLALWALVSDEVHPCLVADGWHVAPAALELARRAATDRVVLVSDASVAAGAVTGSYQQAGVAVHRRADGSVTDEEGTLAGGGTTLDHCLRQWERFTGANLAAAITAASVRPAEAVGLDSGLMTGRPADLVLLDDGGRVQRVMRRGRWIR
jgi:N-acetylglucosamine-6-phosphate deacetylase